MVIVLTRLSRSGDAGEPGYSLSGEELPSPGTKSGAHDWWYAVTQDSFGYVFPSGALVTESFLSTLTTSELDSIRSKIKGVVDDDYFEKRGWCDNFGCYTRYYLKSEIRLLKSVDPCADVSCPDKCVGVDKFDQVCQDGICVRGTLIESDSVHCGYTPEPTPDPTPTPSSDTYIVIALMLAGTYIILRR